MGCTAVASTKYKHCSIPLILFLINLHCRTPTAEEEGMGPSRTVQQLAIAAVLNLCVVVTQDFYPIFHATFL